MAKQIDGNVMEEKKTYNKFQWFLFIVIIPLLFTVALALIVLTVAGVNVFELTKKYSSHVPFLSSSQENNNSSSIKEFQSKIVDLEAEIIDREELVTKLESIIESRETDLETLEIENQRLEEEIIELQAAQEDHKKTLKDIINTYETMKPKKAAPILTALTDEEAVKILSKLKADTLSSILEQMEPEDAARLTQQLTVHSENDPSLNEE
ncbi:MotE family protein [Peribacillus alkalitolerans]|uniref:MotE family protein n=1 Tax=Peribacillus alkalitolerans TaxID=1550385 RepID=UPI0013D255FA|nr:MotE family protein [Peribacillus alkalitolerans]